MTGTSYNQIYQNVKSSQIIIYFKKIINSRPIHSKNIRDKPDPKRVNWGQNPFRVKVTGKSVNLTLDMTQILVSLTLFFVKSVSSWLISGSLLTRNGGWRLLPQWTLFRVKFDPGFFRVYNYILYESQFLGELSSLWTNNE